MVVVVVVVGVADGRGGCGRCFGCFFLFFIVGYIILLSGIYYFIVMFILFYCIES